MTKTCLIYRFIMLVVAVTLFQGCRTTAYGAEKMFEIKTQYETANKDEDGSSRFPLIQEKDGKKYIRKKIGTKVLNEVPGLRDVITLEGESFTEEYEKYKPSDTIEKDGKIYQLKEYSLIDTFVEERTKEVSAVTHYQGVEVIDTLPEKGDVEIVDEDTKQTLTAKLPYKRHKEIKSYWDNSFSFPLTVVSYDAQTYQLGDVEIPKDAELILYGQEFLQYLELPEDYYRILDIQWSGDIYESNGVQRRDAVATGQKMVKDIDVTYAGLVTFEGIQAKAYNSVYELSPKEVGADTMYTVEATATYILDTSVAEQAEDSLWKKTFDWLSMHLTGITVCLVFFICLLITLLLYTKTKKWNKK